MVTQQHTRSTLPPHATTLVTHSSRRRTAFPGIVLLLLLTLGSQASAWAATWGAVAATGTVDEEDVNIVQFGSTVLTGVFPLTINGTAQIKGSAALPANLDIRYNVEAVTPLAFEETDTWGLRARLRDNGTGARIILRLRQVSLFTGAQTVLLTLNSDNFAAADGFQTIETPTCAAANFAFDFDNNAYYIDVQIRKTEASGNPALLALQIFDRSCIE